MMGDSKSKYTYQALEFLNLTSFPFEESYLIPGIVENRNEALTICFLSEIETSTEQKDVNTVLGISRSAMTALTTDMIRKGLITQEPNPDDHRGYLLSLTDLGREIAEWMISRKQAFNKIQTKGFSEKDIETFNSMAIKMAENVLDASERELKKMPNYSDSEWDMDTNIRPVVTEEDKKLFITLTKKVKKIQSSRNIPKRKRK